MHQVMEISEPEAVEDALSRMYTSVRVSDSRSRPPGAVRLEASTLGPLRFDHVTMDIGFQAEVAPLGSILIGWVHAGTATFESRSAERRYGPGDVHLCAQPDDPYRVVLDRLTANVALFDPLILATVAERGPDGSDEPVRLTDYRPHSRQAGRAWARTYDYLSTLTRPGAGPVSPLVIEAATRLLAASSLAAFPNNVLHEPTRTDRHDAHPQTLRRAIGFIEANAGLPLTIADIAREANVSIRAVQLVFRRHLATTPMRFLRQVRLGQARKDLQAAAPGDGVTVTQTAMRWGYPSSSRFAADYRATFGEPPHRTLKHTPPVRPRS